MRLPKPGARMRTVIKRAALVAWLCLVALLIWFQMRDMEWARVGDALRSFEAERITIAALFALAACLTVALYDLIGRNATGHDLPVPRVMLISFTGYFFSLNLGALVGGLAFRYRLYMPYGLAPLTISQVIGLSVVTNWSGYVLIAGGVLAWQPPGLPASWGVGTGVLRGTGIGLLAIAAAYLLLCLLRGGTCVRWKGSAFELPNLRVAALQIALSVASWGSIGGVITAVLPEGVSWLEVIPVLMVSAIAGIWSHVPGGLGVVEAVFLAMLGARIPGSDVLASLLVYRLVYYLAPFLAAIGSYVFLEANSRELSGHSGKVRQ